MNCTSTLEYAFFRLLICLGSHWELDLMFSSDCDIAVVLMACNSLASRDGALAFENFLQLVSHPSPKFIWQKQLANGEC
jgi:hypothetical protein